MIRLLKALFEDSQQQSEASVKHKVHLAAAALLVETARADFAKSAVEISKLTHLLTTALELEPAEVRELLNAAQEKVEDATSLYEFTRVINESCTLERKLQLISAMWKIAYADGDVHKYEEHLIRNVADLIHVPHSNYIQCKLAAQS